MNIISSKKLAAAAVAITLACSAFSEVIDFQSLEAVDADLHFQGFTYSEDGFTLDNLGSESFKTAGTLATRYTGSTAMLNDTINGVTRLTMIGGGLFALNAIDLAELNGSLVASVTFDAYSGATLLGSQTFWLDGIAFAPETFAFGAVFASVDRVEWSQVFPYHQFDNIVVNAAVENPGVPDSGSTLGLMALALAGVACLRRLVRA